MGLPGRADRRAAVLPRHELERGAARTGGGRSRSGRAASGSGAGSRSARSSGCGASARRAPTCRRSWTRPRPALLVAQAIGRIGNYFNQELFGGPTTLPWALRDRPGAPARAATRDYADVPPDVPLRADLEPVARRRSWSGSGATGAIRPPGLFALYVAGLLGFRICEELLRVDPAHHILGLRLNLFVAVGPDDRRAACGSSTRSGARAWPLLPVLGRGRRPSARRSSRRRG